MLSPNFYMLQCHAIFQDKSFLAETDIASSSIKDGFSRRVSADQTGAWWKRPVRVSADVHQLYKLPVCVCLEVLLLSATGDHLSHLPPCYQAVFTSVGERNPRSHASDGVNCRRFQCRFSTKSEDRVSTNIALCIKISISDFFYHHDCVVSYNVFGRSSL